MRVATLTFQSALNYGAALQSYALKEAIKTLGHDCQVLNYECPAIENSYRFFPAPITPRGIAAGLINYGERLRRKKVFTDFGQKYLNLGQRLTPCDIAGASERYDAFVVGSDQVWNPKLTGNDGAYFLNFAEGKKRISYAASAGNGIDDLLACGSAIDAVSLFDHVSVRESDLATKLGQLVERDVMTVVDPVFLLDTSEWRAMAASKIEGDAYVLAYGLHEASVYDTAEGLAKKHGLRCVYVPQGRKTKCDGTKIEAPSVAEFLSLVQHASAVVTDSFHVASFSLLFERPLLVQLKSKYAGMNSRLTTLLKNVGVADTVILPQNDIPDIDYADVKRRLTRLCAASLEWLERSLDE